MSIIIVFLMLLRVDCVWRSGRIIVIFLFVLMMLFFRLVKCLNCCNVRLRWDRKIGLISVVRLRFLIFWFSVMSSVSNMGR